MNDAMTLALVNIPAPWYAPNWFIESRFRKVIGDYEKLSGLQTKLYTLGANRHFGGLYLWTSERDAKAYYNEQWHSRIETRYKIRTQVRFWEVLFCQTGHASFNKQPLSQRSFNTHASASLTEFETSAIPSSLSTLSSSDLPKTLVWRYGLKNERGQLCVLDVWNVQKAEKPVYSDLMVKQNMTFQTPVLMTPAR